MFFANTKLLIHIKKTEAKMATKVIASRSIHDDYYKTSTIFKAPIKEEDEDNVEGKN